jgi:hypothetical protein
MVPTLGLLAVLWYGSADDKPADAKAILNDAVKALGGKEKLAKLPATTFDSQGYLHLPGLQIESKSNWSVQYPDKYRYDGKITIGDGMTALLAIGNGKEGWTKSEGQAANNITAEELTMLHQDTRAVHLAFRPVFLNEKGYELSVLGEIKIDDRPALGIKVVQKGQPDLDLYFDKETHLAVRISFRCNETKDAEPVPHAFTFGDYKEADGLKHFTKIKLFRDEKQILEMNLSNVKLLEKLDDHLFEKP